MNNKKIKSCNAKRYPGSRGFSWFFFATEIKSKLRSGDNKSRKRRGEREKPLFTLASNLTFMQTTAVKRVKLLIKRVTNGNLANTCLSAAIFLSGGRLGKLCYEQTISTWVVKSDLLIGVKLKHVLTMGDKSPGIRTPLYKETNIVPNDCCRICRIYVKISGRSKINVFGYNNKDFSQTLSICSVGCVHDSTLHMTQHSFATKKNQEKPLGPG